MGEVVLFEGNSGARIGMSAAWRLSASTGVGKSTSTGGD